MNVAVITRCASSTEMRGFRIEGPPTEETIHRLSGRLSNYDGVVIDIRECKIPEAVSIIDAVASLRSDVCRWVATPGVDKPRTVALVLFVGSPPDERALIDYATEHLDCPSFWFVTGCEIVIVPREETDISLYNLFVRSKAAFDRLSLHPLLSEGERGKKLFAEHRIDALRKGDDAFRRLVGTEEVRELRIVLPSTYQLEGGASIPLPGHLVEAVFRHVVIELTGKVRGVPTAKTGYTLLDGRGSYFSEKSGRHVEETIHLAQVHLKISVAQAKSLVRYLCFAWLQDEVFCTLDGKVVDP